MDRQRIDKWLWHARVVRTRSDAAGLTEAGHVRLNGRRMTAPGHLVRAGDVVTLEPGLYITGVGGLRIEHNYLVTATGYERLSNHVIALR